MNLLRVIERESPEDFSRTLEAQENLLSAKSADESLPDYLVLVEHKEVYTSGRGAPQQESLTSELRSSTGEPIPWVEIGRGGKATFHGPGQLVAYPIFDLNRHGRDVHIFLRKLETAGIRCLESFGLKAETRPGLTGIWLHDQNNAWRKIVSIGIGVRRWTTFHGLALNVRTDLKYFRAISPCDQDGNVMTSLEELLTASGARVPEMEEVKQRLVESICFEFDLKPESKIQTEPLPPRDRPDWLKVKAPGGKEWEKTNGIVRDLRLVTVCEQARCPNIGECWTHRTATFMIMGELCTRRCSFCSVKDGTLESLDPLDPFEPYRVGRAIKELGLKHVVITSVNRDDLEDMGAAHFHQTVKAIANQNPDCRIELLIPDMRGQRHLVETILQSGLVHVLNHNVETVPRLYKTVRPGASFKRSLNILKWSKEVHPDVKSKSGVMVGLGEEFSEVLAVMDSLREVGVEILTIGQYLQPSAKQLPITRYVTPDEFAAFKVEGIKRGFSYVESGPLVRSSYHAWQHTGDLEQPHEFAAANTVNR